MGSTANNLYLCSDLLVVCKSGNHAVDISPYISTGHTGIMVFICVGEERENEV